MNAARAGRTPGAVPQRAYDAFLSYSHGADGRLAPALQRGLQRLTRAWYQRQALRIFRDQTSLAASADLPATIERALRSSRCFVLLASPTAARSPWVGREVRFWQEHRERDTFFIALTDGVIRWDEAAGDFDWAVTDALPEDLRGWFPHEPLWMDLTWTRSRDPSDLTLRHGRFRDDVATLAAALHGRPKEQIDSEDARQHRRAVRLGRAIVALLLLLLVIAGVQTNNANTQRDIAVQQKSIAQQQRALAVQRLLEADAQVDAPTSPATSLDMSLAALQVHPSAQVRQTLVNTLLHTSYQGSSQPQTPGGVAQTAVFSPDGRLLADTYDGSSGNTVVSLWNTVHPTKPSRLANLPGIAATAAVTDIALSPDDRVLAIAVGAEVELWSPTAVPRLLATLPLSGAQAVAFSPGGTTLAAVGGNSANGTVETWNVADPAAPRLLARVGGVYFPDQAAFSPDGRTLVTGSGEETFTNSGAIMGRTRTVLWDVSDPRAPRQLATIQVWDGEGGFAFAPNGKTLAITWSNEVALYDIAAPANPRQLTVLVGDTEQIDAVAFSPDGRRLTTGGDDDQVLLWNTTDPASVPKPTRLAQDTTSISALTFVHGGQSVLSSDSNTQVGQWLVADNAPTLAATLTDPANRPGYVDDYVDAVAVSPDGRVLATAYYDQAVVLWNITDPARPVELARITASRGPVSAVAFSPDGGVLAVGSWDDQLSLFNVRDPASPQLLDDVATPGVVSWLAFTPAGGTLAGGGDALVQGTPGEFSPAWSNLWKTSDPGHPTVLHSFSDLGADDPGALSPDGKTLVLPTFFNGNLNQSPVEVWNVASPAHPVQLPNPDTTSPLAPQPDQFSNLSDQLTFAPVRGLAATASDAQTPDVVLWSYNGHSAARQVSAITGPSQTIQSLSFHPGGNLLAAASQDFTTTIWDVADQGQPFTVQTISGDTGAVNDAVFSTNGRLLVTGSEDGITQVWTLNALPSIAANPVGLACQITGGGFTRAQWAQNVPGIPYSASCP